MGNIISKPKIKQIQIKQPNLLKNTVYCNYCNNDLLFCDYYKHIIDCKKNFLSNN